MPEEADGQSDQFGEKDLDVEAEGGLSHGLTRRRVMGAGLGALVAAALARFGVRPARAATREKLCDGALSLLPSSSAERFLKQTLAPDPTFRRFLDFYTEQGFEFVPSRVQLALGVNASPAPGAPPSRPFLLAIVPSFRPVERTDPSHEAVSIVALRERKVNTVLSAAVVVNHRPFAIASFSVTELDRADPANPRLVTQTVEREVLERETVDEIARRLAVPFVELDASVSTLAVGDIEALAAVAFRNVLTDSFAAPMYPPAGLRSLLRDTPLVQKWSLVQAARYAALVPGVIVLCSSSCSCNACSSCSSSSVITA